MRNNDSIVGYKTSIGHNSFHYPDFNQTLSIPRDAKITRLNWLSVSRDFVPVVAEMRDGNRSVCWIGKNLI